MLLRQLAFELKDTTDIVVTVIGTSVRKPGWIGRLGVLVRVLIGSSLSALRHDTMAFHGSVNGIFLAVPALRVISWLFRRPLIVRAFGCGLDSKYESASFLWKLVFRICISRCDLLLVETHALVKSIRRMGVSRVEWYSNSRPLSDLADSVKSRRAASRFIFLGHVKKDKGVLDLVAAFSRLDSMVHLFIYGPLVGDIDRRELEGANVTFCGEIAQEEIESMFQTMDVLMLFTHYRSEGYPGAILEAYANGLPVIASRLGGIPEIVHSGSGILVAPGDIDGLVAAVRTFSTSPGVLSRGREAARELASDFDSKKWTARYADFLRDIKPR